MFGFIKKIFIWLLTSVANVSSHTKCVSLSNQKPTLINLYPTEYTQGFSYYPFAVYLDRCVQSCDTVDHLSNKVCVPNKAYGLNLI